MTANALAEVCRAALAKGRYVTLTHRGVSRDVYPFSIRDYKLYCYCTIHPERDVESMYLSNIGVAYMSQNEVGLLFAYPSEFE